MQPDQPKYIAQLNHVCELGLWGTANLAWWQRELAHQQLEPVEAEGGAQVIVTALDASWMRIPFRDLSVAVVASRAGSADEQGLYFASAFNASRFIACTERRWFGLPYQFRSDLHINLRDTAVAQLGEASNREIDLEFGKREPSNESSSPEPLAQPMTYVGPLFLPSSDGSTRSRWLVVKIDGLTETHSFDETLDRFTLGEDGTEPIFDALRESSFQPARWHRRHSATHARTKTYSAKR